MLQDRLRGYKIGFARRGVPFLLTSGGAELACAKGHLRSTRTANLSHLGTESFLKRRPAVSEKDGSAITAYATDEFMGYTNLWDI